MIDRTAKHVLSIMLLFGLAACATPKAAAPPATLTSTGSWVMYQRSADHNAVLPAAGATPWKFDTGGHINGGLAVVGTTVLVDTFAHELLALDIRTGNVLWRSKADTTLMSSPVVADGMVYVGSGDSGRLSGGGGRATYASTYSSGHEAAGNPVWGRPEGDAMIAYDLATGERKWAFRTVGEDMPSPAFVDGTLVFVNGDLHTYGLNARSGEQKWTHEVDGLGTMASATAAAGLVYLSVCNEAPYRCQTLAVDPHSGNVSWHAPYGNSDSSPTVGDGRVYVSGIVNDRAQIMHAGFASVSALDAKTGRPAWKYRTPQAGPYTEVASSERAVAGTYANGIFYQAIPTHDALVAFDAKTGAVRWRATSAAPIKMSPVIAGGRLYVGDTAGVLYTFDARTGALQSRELFKKPFTTSPPVVVGKMMLVTNDSVVYSLPLK